MAFVVNALFVTGSCLKNGYSVFKVPYPAASIRSSVKENGICFFPVRMGKVYFGAPSDRRHCQRPCSVYIWVLCVCFQTGNVSENIE